MTKIDRLNAENWGKMAREAYMNGAAFAMFAPDNTTFGDLRAAALSYATKVSVEVWGKRLDPKE